MTHFVQRAAEITDRIPAVGVVVGGLYLLLSLSWWLVSQLLLGVIIVVNLALDGGLTQIPTDLGELMPTWLMATGYALTVGGMVMVGVVLAPLTGRTQGRAFALALPRWWTVILALLAGLSVGLFPGWVAEQLRLYLPQIDLGALDMISDMLTSGPLWERALMALAVCVAAPLFEELVFRGFLWDALNRSMPAWLVWILTSLIFAAYHLDPVQASAVVFTGAVLGWLRWTTGSVWPGVVMHAANNTLATVAATVWASSEEPLTPWWGAFMAAALTLALVGPTLLVRRSRPPSG